MNQEFTPREHLTGWAAFVLLATALPRVVYWLRWPTRLGPRGLLAYIAGKALLLFGLRHYQLPHVKRIADEHVRLTERLGREPTDDEFADHLGYNAA